MNLSHLAMLRNCCRNEAAFEQVQQLFARELQTALAQLQWQNQQQQALGDAIARIRASLDLDTIFQATASEVRQLLGADRVGVFRFYPNSGWNQGEFVSEAVLPDYPSAIAHRVDDHCFGEKYAIHYQHGRVQAVADIHTAGLSDCHVYILSRFQIRANLIVPLLQGDLLWGLICIHQCSGPRQWQESEIEFVRQIATHLGVALSQADLLEQTQRQTQQLTHTLAELQSTQLQLVQSEKMSSLGQLVAGVAHEINNPVNFIHGNVTYAAEYAEGLLELLRLYQTHYPHPVEAIETYAEKIDLEFLLEDLPKMLSSMQVGTERIRQIVVSLRNFSRLDQAETKPVNIHEGIDSTLLILQHRFKSRNHYPPIQVNQIYGDLPPVECYAGQLNQVFMNILCNAIDALEQENDERSRAGLPVHSGQITIRTTSLCRRDSNQPWVVIQIADNGPGMPEGVRSRIFDPFFTTKPIGQGTGLGLSISYQIVTEKHGGVLRCLSQPGQGTEFWIELPIRSGETRVELDLAS